jgi:hypothetical protein
MQETDMRRMIPLATAFAVAVVATASAFAAGDEPKTRAEQCRERAKAMKFGLHLIRRDHWIRDCIRGKV